MSNYKLSGLILEELQYNFSRLDYSKISVFVRDSIKIVEIHDNEATLKIIRELRFGEGTDTFVRTVFEANVTNRDLIEKSDLVETIKTKRNNFLVPVYSKSSLLISQITNMSPFGVVVTPPGYDTKELDIN